MVFYNILRSAKMSSMALPIPAGDGTTVTPADFRAAILSPAPPLPPAMIAPACPMRLPGGR